MTSSGTVDTAIETLRWSRGKLERVSACPACGCDKRQGEPLVCADHRTDLRDQRWTLHRCASCRSLYLDPRPDAESLPRAYESYYTHIVDDERPATSGLGGLLWRAIHGYLNSRFGLARQPAAAWGYWLFRLLPPLRLKLDYYGRHLYADRFPERGRLLDVGCGNGTFLARACEMGWTVTGLEPDAKAVAVCRAQGLDVVQGDLECCPDSWRGEFDVVTMSHCIEHVEEPAQDLKRVLSLLRPGGLLWMALPNPESLGAAYFSGAWRGLHAPFHLCIPSAAALRALLSKAGFVDIRAVRRGAHAKMICRESAKNARAQDGRWLRMKAQGAPLLRPLIDLSGTIFPSLAEETVITAHCPVQT